ncbi:hypothetical protein H0H93_008774, partial [Arthromyces matolae]
LDQPFGEHLGVLYYEWLAASVSMEPRYRVTDIHDVSLATFQIETQSHKYQD